MKIVGLIAEYNPFHNGHEYHIQKAKEVTGADTVIVVMSGNFVQRGAPAIMPKHLRAKVALKSGASLVLELPVCFATGSAEYFAQGAVALLDSLGCVDALCFGSECGDIQPLTRIAEVLSDEPEEYRALLRASLKEGLPFPSARERALQDYLHDPALSRILASPNNTLGVEYIKALIRQESTIRPYTILRKDSRYHADTLEPAGNFSSATAIRRLLLFSGSSLRTVEDTPYDEPKLSSILARLEDHVPRECVNLLERTHLTRYPIYSNDFSLLIKYQLMRESRGTLTRYADVSEELANRIMKHLNSYQNFDQFCDLIKTKEVTYSRISRCLLHIMLGIQASFLDRVAADGFIHYARMLGFVQKEKEILSFIKKNSRILYESVISNKFKTPFCNEYSHPLVIV